MDKKTVSVKKIKETSDGWNLYPTDCNQASIFISKKDYSGKMPPFFRWPWQEVELKLTLVEDFQISATIDGHTLFEIPEKDYPPVVKERLKRGEALYQEAVAQEKKRDEAISAALMTYLDAIPCNPHLENELSSLKPCLRVYMKMHLFKGSSGKEHQQRLSLMMLICKIVQRIYTRHVDEKATFGIAMAAFEYGLKWNFPYYAAHIEDYEKIAKEQGDSEVIFELYREVDSLMGELLPPLEDDALKRYLNYLVRQVLGVFSEDMAELNGNHLRDAWGHRIYDDEGDYERLYQKMQLLKFHSLLLPEVFTDKVIESFIHSYNLK